LFPEHFLLEVIVNDGRHIFLGKKVDLDIRGLHEFIAFIIELVRIPATVVFNNRFAKLQRKGVCE
jgi:hypothetical protein